MSEIITFTIVITDKPPRLGEKLEFNSGTKFIVTVILCIVPSAIIVLLIVVIVSKGLELFAETITYPGLQRVGPALCLGLAQSVLVVRTIRIRGIRIDLINTQDESAR